MNSFLDDLFSFLTTSPGNVIYHLVLVGSIAATLWAVMQAQRGGRVANARRQMQGMIALLALQGVLFLASAFAWWGWIEAHAVLPPLDRLVVFLSLAVITWLWGFPSQNRRADGALVIVCLLTTVFFVINLVRAGNAGARDFNTTEFETTWQAFSLALAVLGSLLLLIRRKDGWQSGLAMLLLIGLGHLISLVVPRQGDFPGFLRLFHLAAFPILPALLQNLKPEAFRWSTVLKRDGTDPSALPERRRYSTDNRTFQALLELGGEADAAKIGPVMTRAIAQAMLADLCFLLVMPEGHDLTITCGYDLIREQPLPGFPVSKDAVPALVNAIKRGRPLRLTAGSRNQDLDNLAEILNLTNSGHLLSVPIASSQPEFRGAILILSPYSNRLWNADDENFLANGTNLLYPILERGSRVSQIQKEHEQALKVAGTGRDLVKDSQKKLDDLSTQLALAQEKVAQFQVQAASLAALKIQHEESQNTIDTLNKQIDQMQQVTGPTSRPVESAQGEKELRKALEDLAHMQNTLANANRKIDELKRGKPVAVSNEQGEVIASISQDLRQPMSSIIGYTDLMLGESVGILGALQRKFVERIKAATERVGGLVDDLIQVTNLGAGGPVFTPAPVDLNLIIDNSMAGTSTQIREKNITLRLDIPDDLPLVVTDRDAIQQVFINLLQNATAASPLEGTITLRVQMQPEAEGQYLSIQVTDSGGGIDAGDIPHVFDRRYRAEEALIPGVGDAGVGLSIARSLVESQSGRIWVETEFGKGSTYCVLLPVSQEPGGG